MAMTCGFGEVSKKNRRGRRAKVGRMTRRFLLLRWIGAVVINGNNGSRLRQNGKAKKERKRKKERKGRDDAADVG